MEFKHYVDVLHSFYEQHGLLLQLNAGASECLLDAVDAELGQPITAELRDAWRACNGGAWCWQTVFANPGYMTGYSFLTIADALEERATMKKRSALYGEYVDPEPRDPRVRDGWFHDGWLPFAGFGGGTLLLLQDYSPTEAGRVGQILSFSHDPDSIEFVATSLSELLTPSLENILSNPDDFLVED